GAGPERDLPEVVAGTDRADGLAVHGHFRLALFDDEESCAACSLLEEDVARGHAPLTHRGRDLLDLAVVEPREERNLLQHVGRGAGHAGVIHRSEGWRPSARMCR